MEAGKDHGLRPTGMGVYAVTGRIEKGYRLMGAELESEYNPVEAGLARPKVKANDFIGKEAYLAAREKGDPEVQCVTLHVDDNTDGQGRKRFMMGGNEPILDRDGERIDRQSRPSVAVTTAGYGPSSARTCCSVTCPRRWPSRARSSGHVHERALPVHGCGHRVGVRPRQHPPQGQLIMRILALVKRVPAPGARINITADGQHVDDKNLGHAISPHEECGVEAAVQLVETARWRCHRADARSARGRGAAACCRVGWCGQDGARADRRHAVRSAAHGRRAHDGDQRARGSRRCVRPDHLRQRERRLRVASRWAFASPMRWAGRWSTASRDSTSRVRPMATSWPTARSTLASRCTSCPCPHVLV